MVHGIRSCLVDSRWAKPTEFIMSKAEGVGYRVSQLCVKILCGSTNYGLIRVVQSRSLGTDGGQGIVVSFIKVHKVL